MMKLLSATVVALASIVIPPHQGYVTDVPSMLTAPQRDALNQKLIDYKNRTKNEFAILIVPTLGDSDIKEYSNRAFHEWGLGIKGVDNGLLLVWATAERRVRIEVGRGLEGRLTDGATGQILRERILPQFKQSQWYTGLNAGVDAVIEHIGAGDTPIRPAAAQTASSDDGAWGDFIIIVGAALLFFIGIWALIVYRTRKRARVEEERDRDRINAYHSWGGISNEEVARLADRPSAYRPSVRTSPVRSTSRPVRRTYSSGSTYEPPTISSPVKSPSSSSPSSSDSGPSFSGGDSSGGGADGSY